MFDISKFQFNNNVVGIGTVLILLTVLAVLFINSKRKTYKEITSLVPADGVVIPGYAKGQAVPIAEILKYAPARTDLLYGYYSSLDRSFDQTKDHISMFWNSMFFAYAPDLFIKILKEFNGKVVMDVGTFLTIGEQGKRKSHNPDGIINLVTFFTTLKDAGVLDKISYVYPIDEPNLTMLNSDEHSKIIDMTEIAMAYFQELNNAKTAVIFAAGGSYWNIERFDVVGIDRYKLKSSILLTEHKSMVDMLEPGQKTMIVPGAGFGDAPEPFFAYALANPNEVEMIVPFIWFDDPNHKDVEYTGLENASTDYKERWILLAKLHANKDTRTSVTTNPRRNVPH